MLRRRDFIERGLAATVAGALARPQPTTLLAAPWREPFRPKWLVASSLYGCLPLQTIAPEVAKTGSHAIDIWPLVHGNQREQIDEMGEEAFAKLLETHQLSLGCLTQYKLGPFGLASEMRLAERFGCKTIVTGGKGPSGLKGETLRSAVEEFARQLQPHLGLAEKTGVTIAIENHASTLIDSPDAIGWLLELQPSPWLAIALAPYHLPQDEILIARLIRECGPRIGVFYAWQHGKGCMMPQPKADELLQMPGRGPLDFRPLVEALRDVRYDGWVEIFMHPFPRGVPILETASEVTAEINRARNYLQQFT